MNKINIGIIGVGYWGPNIARNLNSLEHVCLSAICDLSAERLHCMENKYPEVKTEKDYCSLLRDKDIDAIVISTPPSTHALLAREALLNDKHVLVEKPLAMNTLDARALIDIASKKKKVLMVGHTFIYNAAVRKLKECVASGEIGKVYYIYSQRLNLGIVRKDINAMWNFAPHDISIILYILDKLPCSVTAKGLSYLRKEIQDVVYLHLDFKDGINAHIHVSWLDPNKTRKMTVVGSKKMVVYDDVSINQKIQVYDKGFVDEYETIPFKDFGEFQLIQHCGELVVPKINFIEPLQVECDYFVECIRHNKKPITDGESGFHVVKILEAAQKSIECGGGEIRIDWKEQ